MLLCCERKKEDNTFSFPSLLFFFFSCFIAAASLNVLWSPRRLIVTELIETERLYVEELQSIIEVQSSQV